MASERPNSPPVVVLDANLLYPFQLRNLLVQFGVDCIIAPRWTARIHEEWMGNLIAPGRVPLDRLRRTRDLMDRALPNAEVKGWEPHMDGLVLPDPDDRHILAAALAVADDPELVRASTEAAHANLSRSTPSFADYLDAGWTSWSRACLTIAANRCNSRATAALAHQPQEAPAMQHIDPAPRFAYAPRIVGTAAVLVLASLVLSACNTTEGVGKDVSATGAAVTRGANDVKSGL